MVDISKKTLDDPDIHITKERIQVVAKNLTTQEKAELQSFKQNEIIKDITINGKDVFEGFVLIRISHNMNESTLEWAKKPKKIYRGYKKND